MEVAEEDEAEVEVPEERVRSGSRKYRLGRKEVMAEGWGWDGGRCARAELRGRVYTHLSRERTIEGRSTKGTRQNANQTVNKRNDSIGVMKPGARRENIPTADKQARDQREKNALTRERRSKGFCALGGKLQRTLGKGCGCAGSSRVVAPGYRSFTESRSRSWSRITKHTINLECQPLSSCSPSLLSSLHHPFIVSTIDACPPLTPSHLPLTDEASLNTHQLEAVS